MADTPQRSDEGPILTEAAHRDLHAWRAAHPQATFADREGAVEERGAAGARPDARHPAYRTDAVRVGRSRCRCALSGLR